MIQANLFQNQSMLFSGRMKTVKEKSVTSSGESNGCFMNHSDPKDPSCPPGIFPALLTGAGAGISLVNGVLTPEAGLVSLPVFLLPSLGIPATSWGVAQIMDRKVTYLEKKVPMTEAEELAVMTPIEKAHWEIDQALKKWQGVREKYQANLTQLEARLQVVQNELNVLQTAPSDGDHYTGLKRAAKENTLKELTDLTLVSKKMLQDLDGQIKEKEESLFAAKEKLDMMRIREDVLSLHQQLQTGEQTSQEAQGLKKDAALQPILEDLEKQKIKLEAIMASVQTAMDVNAVLNTM
jgi:hypothetical protein